MTQLAMLNRLVLQGSEVRVEVSILKINDRLTNKVITKESIVVPELHLEWRAAWESRLELKHSMNIRRLFISLMIVSVAVLFLSKNNFHEWVRRTV